MEDLLRQKTRIELCEEIVALRAEVRRRSEAEDGAIEVAEMFQRQRDSALADLREARGLLKSVRPDLREFEFNPANPNELPLRIDAFLAAAESVTAERAEFADKKPVPSPEAFVRGECEMGDMLPGSKGQRRPAGPMPAPDAVREAWGEMRSRVARAAGQATSAQHRQAFQQVSAWFMEVSATLREQQPDAVTPKYERGEVGAADNPPEPDPDDRQRRTIFRKRGDE